MCEIREHAVLYFKKLPHTVEIQMLYDLFFRAEMTLHSNGGSQEVLGSGLWFLFLICGTQSSFSPCFSLGSYHRKKHCQEKVENENHSMILQLQTVAVICALIQSAVAWPITPLDGYSRTDTQYLEVSCGNDTEIREATFTNLNITFADYGDLEPGCTVRIRIAVQDLDVDKYGVRITGMVELFDSSNDDQCSSSYLSIADEDDLDDELGSIERYCNEEEIDFKTTEDIIVIEFVVGGNGASGMGFQLMVSPHYLCGGLVELEDPITTPDFPEPYPRDINCVWRVTAPEGHHIVLRCSEFDLKPKRGKRCMDYLLIITDGRPMTYCGDELREKEVMSNSNVMLMDFRSNKYKNNKLGFRCKPKFIRDTKDLLLAKFFK
ncbi:hypothetical protein SK128_010616 [Halocaridina rubra]|uniref:CUB domain-containing protein n=1 Tax=Halocaridina rubra TaxID=373956 RepID=A0AAN8XI86_HALRR